MGISAIVTRGWLFSIALIVTAGYNSGPEIVVTSRAVCFIVPAENRASVLGTEGRSLLVAVETRSILVPTDC